MTGFQNPRGRGGKAAEAFVVTNWSPMTTYDPSIASVPDSYLDAAPQVPASGTAHENFAVAAPGKGVQGRIFKPSGAVPERAEGKGCGEAVGGRQEGVGGSGGTDWSAYGDGDAPFAVGNAREPWPPLLKGPPAPTPTTDEAGIVGMHHSRVDLSPFQMPTVKFDRLDVRCDSEHLTRAGRAKIRKGLTHGTLTNVPKRVLEAHGPHLQINDPGVEDLQFLVEHFRDSAMLRVEIAIDFHLDGPLQDVPLYALRDQLRHCLYPQKHELLRGAKRKVFRSERKGYAADGLGQPLPTDAGQLIWEDQSTGCQLAVYVKQKDCGQDVEKFFVRMEVRFTPSGCARIGLQKIGLLPRFAKGIRKNLSDMFFVAQGFKHNSALVGRGIPKSPWCKYGAQWAKNGRAQLKVDADVNCRLQQAVNNFRTKLVKIQPPSAVFENYDAWCAECDSELIVPSPPNTKP